MSEGGEGEVEGEGEGEGECSVGGGVRTAAFVFVVGKIKAQPAENSEFWEGPTGRASASPTNRCSLQCTSHAATPVSHHLLEGTSSTS